MQSIKIALIGCGSIGQKRAQMLKAGRSGGALSEVYLTVCADRILARAETLAGLFSGCRAVDDWRAAVEAADVDAVVISTTHDALAEITRAALAARKHVLVDKPAGRNPAELNESLLLVEQHSLVARVGFNHRYHPALLKARALVDEGAVGELMYIRGRYGHGGRLGYEKEWRADPALSGGGELIDQGVHLIDLSRWFLGDFVKVDGLARTFYWDMPVDDNGFMLLQTQSQRVAFLHASCSEWKNLFSFEIYGKTGKLHIDGLGGSYGLERLAYYKMLPQMGPPETQIWEYPMGDQSWRLEFEAFLEDIRLGRPADPGLPDAQAALRVVEQIYQRSGMEW